MITYFVYLSRDHFPIGKGTTLAAYCAYKKNIIKASNPTNIYPDFVYKMKVILWNFRITINFIIVNKGTSQGCVFPYLF